MRASEAQTGPVWVRGQNLAMDNTTMPVTVEPGDTRDSLSFLLAWPFRSATKEVNHDSGRKRSPVEGQPEHLIGGE